MLRLPSAMNKSVHWMDSGQSGALGDLAVPLAEVVYASGTANVWEGIHREKIVWDWRKIIGAV